MPGVIDKVIELVLSVKVNQVIEGWKKQSVDPHSGGTA